MNNHNENIGRAREWIAYLKKTAKHPSGNLGELLKEMIDDALSAHALIDKLEKAIKEAQAVKVKKKDKKDKNELSDETKVTIESVEDAKLPDEA